MHVPTYHLARNRPQSLISTPNFNGTKYATQISRQNKKFAMENFSGQKLGEGVADWLEWLL